MSLIRYKTVSSSLYKEDGPGIDDDGRCRVVFNILTLLPITDKMVQIGKAVKYDDYGRVTCPSVLAEMLDLQKGVDEVTWHVEDGKVILKKVTKIYIGGFDFETEEIEEKLKKYESHYCEVDSTEGLGFEEIQARARAQYEKDKEARRAVKDRKKSRS